MAGNPCDPVESCESCDSGIAAAAVQHSGSVPRVGFRTVTTLMMRYKREADGFSHMKAALRFLFGFPVSRSGRIPVPGPDRRPSRADVALISKGGPCREYIFAGLPGFTNPPGWMTARHATDGSLLAELRQGGRLLSAIQAVPKRMVINGLHLGGRTRMSTRMGGAHFSGPFAPAPACSTCKISAPAGPSARAPPTSRRQVAKELSFEPNEVSMDPPRSRESAAAIEDRAEFEREDPRTLSQRNLSRLLD